MTTATWLFQAGVEEQLIMSRTGHQSLDGVRTYKRVSEEQCQQVSSVLNSATNCMEESPHQNKKIKLVDGQDHDEQASQPLTLFNCTNVTTILYKRNNAKPAFKLFISVMTHYYNNLSMTTLTKLIQFQENNPGRFQYNIETLDMRFINLILSNFIGQLTTSMVEIYAYIITRL